MTEWAARRFWTEVQLVAVGDNFSIQLDGRPVRTPAKADLILPTRAFAEAVEAEWTAQGDLIDPRAMPFTRTANSAIDNVARHQPQIAEMIAEYGTTDLLCYRAEAPMELIARQCAEWDPLLDWADKTFGARLRVGAGVMHVPQPHSSLAALSKQVHQLDPFRLAALHDLVALSGSLVIGLAGLRGYLRAEALWALSRIDEQWQIECWGEDEEATVEADAKRAGFLHAAAVLAHLDSV